MTAVIHSGILGMKWGVRRYQYKDGSLTPEGRKRYGSGSDSKPVSRTDPSSQKSNSKSVTDMSDDELRSKVNRLQLERTYSQLISSANVNKGENVTQKALKKMGDSFVSTLAQKSGEAMAKKIVNSIFGEEDKKKKNKN